MLSKTRENGPRVQILAELIQDGCDFMAPDMDKIIRACSPLSLGSDLQDRDGEKHLIHGLVLFDSPQSIPVQTYHSAFNLFSS